MSIMPSDNYSANQVSSAYYDAQIQRQKTDAYQHNTDAQNATDQDQTPAFDVQLSGQNGTADKNNKTNTNKKIQVKEDSNLRTADGRKPTVSEESDLKQEAAEYAQDDQHVRNHEAAHMAAGGQFAGAATYTYKKGPDGKMYAVAGEVSLDMSTETDPRKNLTKAQQLQRAALAPADPSPQDLAVASSATAIAQKASADIREETSKKASSVSTNSSTAKNDGNADTINKTETKDNTFSPYKNKSDNLAADTIGKTVDIAA